MRRRSPNTWRDLDLALIDEPTLPMRQGMDEEGLIELAHSIRVNGLMAPIVVKARGERFEIIAGHRRFVAFQRLEEKTIPAIVRDVTDDEVEALKTAENTDREDVNAAAEATYFSVLFVDRCGEDVDRLCELVKRKRAYVEQRLLLFAGDPEVLAAVAAGQVSLSVATELNKIQSDDGRRMYLDAAKKGGASVRSVRQWVAQAAAFDELQAGAPPPPDGAVAPPAQPYGSSLVCIICEANDNPHELDLVYVHRSCRRLVLDHFLRTLRPAPAAAPSKGES